MFDIIMHEFSIAGELVETLLDALDGKKVEKVEEIHLEVGELTFLAERQLKFAIKLTSEGTILEGADVIIINMPAEITCHECGYNGSPAESAEEVNHVSFPIVSCPKCKGPVEITGGKECIIKNVKAIVEDD